MKKYCLLVIVTLMAWGNLYSIAPYNVEVEEMNIPGAPGLHSFVFAQHNGKWLLIGGRTNGLHGFTPATAFPRQFQNKFVYVIDPVNNQVWSRNLFLDLSIAAADPLRSTNMQSVQVGTNLIVTGGYGIDSNASATLVTFPILSVIDVPSIIQAVMNNQSMSSSIKQVTDSRIQVTGGEMEYYDGYYYLFGGHKFTGNYFNTGQGNNNQVYTNQMKKFHLTIAGPNVNITDYSAVTDTVNFHRRDLNMMTAIKPDGSQCLMVHGGVFRYDKDLPFLKPIIIDNLGYTVNAYEQKLNQYTTAHLLAFDSVSGEMHTTYFGGIGQYYYDEVSQQIKEDTLVPFVNEITTMTRSSANVFTENISTVRMPDLLGSNAQFIANHSLQYYSNEVLKVRKLVGRTLVGHIYGGIRAQMPNLAPSTANDKIYKVYLTFGVGINPIGTEIPSAFNLQQNYPNPFNPSTKIRFDIPASSGSDKLVKLAIYDALGKEVSVLVNENLKAGSYEASFDGTGLTGGVYFYSLRTSGFTQTKKMLLIK